MRFQNALMSGPRRLFRVIAVLVVSAIAQARAAEPPAAPALQITCKEAGTLTATTEAGRTIFVIRGGSGIGRATITLKAGPWPPQVTLRAYLGGLEHLAIASGKVKLSAAFTSTGEHRQLLHLWTDGKEGPQLTKESPYWLEIQALDAAGQPLRALPPKGGWFELTIPKALLTGEHELTLEWIDFYRG